VVFECQIYELLLTKLKDSSVQIRCAVIPHLTLPRVTLIPYNASYYGTSLCNFIDRFIKINDAMDIVTENSPNLELGTKVKRDVAILFIVR
jgi:hypothetical protein